MPSPHNYLFLILRSSLYHDFFFCELLCSVLFYFLIDVQVTYRVVLVSSVQQSDSVLYNIHICIYIHTHILFPHFFHYALLQYIQYIVVPCAKQYGLIVYHFVLFLK